jgi:hypothetical protein
MEKEIVDAEAALRFILAGNARVTLRSLKTGKHFSFKVSKPEGAKAHFVKVLDGPDNTSDYAYIGFIRDEREYVWGGDKARMGVDAPSNQAFAWTFRHLLRGEVPSELQIWHEGRCGRCGRVLTSPESIVMGLGPVCATL